MKEWERTLVNKQVHITLFAPDGHQEMEAENHNAMTGAVSLVQSPPT